MQNRPKIIVVGSGLSGSSAAYAAVECDVDVALISLDVPYRSNSATVREGVNRDPSPEAHILDTLACGDGLAPLGAVRRMCESAPSIVHLVERMGVVFDRRPDGSFVFRHALGSKHRRTVTAGRFTGQRILAALDGQLRRRASEGRISLLFGWEFLSPVVDDNGVCRGVVAMNLRSMEIKPFPADAVILCTGGFASIYDFSAASLYNDGAAAMACHVCGAKFANPEFVQFYPYAVGASGKGIPLGDQAIAEGGRVFVLHDGKPFYFLDEWFSEGGRGLRRDLATRAIHRIMNDSELGGDDGHVYFDLSGAGSGDADSCPERVFPVAYQTLGGLSIDDDHATTVKGLFASGSAASGYHGASMLGGNEALASLHGGMIAGRSSARYSKGKKGFSSDVPASLLDLAKTREEDINSHIASREGSENAHALARELGNILSENANIARDNRRLKDALDGILALKERFDEAPLLDRSEWSNQEIVFMRRLKARFDLARMVVAAAMARDETRGVHYKPEFPVRDDDRWQVVTEATWTADGSRLEYSRVREPDGDDTPKDQKAG